MEEKEGRLAQQLENAADRAQDGLSPNWIDVLKNIFSKWETWVALAATGGAVTYFVSEKPSVQNIVNPNINNQIQVESPSTDSSVNLFEPLGGSSETNKTIDSIMQDLFRDIEILPNIGLENTAEINIPDSAEKDIQDLLDIYNEAKL